MKTSLTAICALVLVSQAHSFSIDRNAAAPSPPTQDRRDFMKRSFGILAGSMAGSLPVSPSFAAPEKLNNISNEKLAEIIAKDIRDGQFMVTADISREVYSENAKFIDEIDTYEMDKWIVGTKRLFVAEKSHVDLVPDSMKATESEVTFRFTETLQFRLPLPKRPTVYLSGSVVLTRDPETGLINEYREKWDQSIPTVLTSAEWS